MFKHQLALIKRELWEHRSIYVVPSVTAAIMTLIAITGKVSISGFDQEIDIALLGATNLGTDERGAIISFFLAVFAMIFALEMLFIIVFYSLDALYAERKDKSILFWRSLPVTDAETVISKLLTAVIVIPIVTLAFVVVTQLLILLSTSIWVGTRGADAGYLIWQATPLFDNWAATLIYVLALALWLSPFIGWFLLVSAYTKRSPLMMAVLPLIVLPILEYLVLRTHLFNDILQSRSPVKMPIFSRADITGLFEEEMFHQSVAQGLSLMSMLDVGKFLSSPGLWIGFVACGLLTTAAIYVRRFRDDS